MDFPKELTEASRVLFSLGRRDTKLEYQHKILKGMSKLPKPISNYVDRFRQQYEALNLSAASNEDYEDLINNNASRLNNLLMSGLGACTLILRMGADYKLSQKA